MRFLNILCACEPGSFGRENVVAIIILLQVFGGNKLSKFNVRSFIIYQLGDGLTSFNKDSSANFSGKKKYHKDFQGVYFASIREKTLTWFVQL